MFVVSHNGSSVLGGGELAPARLLAGLQERGHRVLMLCRDVGMAQSIARYGIPTGVQRIGGGLMLPDAFRFAARLRRLQPDAVILTTFRKVFLAGLGARLAGVPFVVQRVGLSTDVPRGIGYRIALRRFVDLVVLNAVGMRPPFLAAGPDLEDSSVVALSSGVARPVRRPEPGALRRELAIPPEARVVGTVGRLAQQKRFDRLLWAFSRLPADAHCLIVGEGEAREALQALALELGVADRVHLPGFREDIGDVLHSLDVFVVSSDREGMANAMLEAMACGKPVVSTAVSGAGEALAAAETGELAPGVVVGFSDEELHAALRRLLDDEALRVEMGRAASRRWELCFDSERLLDEWEALLHRGIALGRRRS